MEFPKVRNQDANDNIEFYGFKNKALLADCLAKGCALLQPNSAIVADELNVGFKLITSIGVEIWRLEKRLNKLDNENPNLELTPFFDQVQRIKDIFMREGIVIKDYLTEGYKEGISLKVLSFEEDASLPPGALKVVETVRPTIFYKDKVIFHGEVVVAKSTQNKQGE